MASRSVDQVFCIFEILGSYCKKKKIVKRKIVVVVVVVLRNCSQIQELETKETQLKLSLGK